MKIPKIHHPSATFIGLNPRSMFLFTSKIKTTLKVKYPEVKAFDKLLGFKIVIKEHHQLIKHSISKNLDAVSKSRGPYKYQKAPYEDFSFQYPRHKIKKIIKTHVSKNLPISGFREPESIINKLQKYACSVSHCVLYPNHCRIKTSYYVRVSSGLSDIRDKYSAFEMDHSQQGMIIKIAGQKLLPIVHLPDHLAKWSNRLEIVKLYNPNYETIIPIPSLFFVHIQDLILDIKFVYELARTDITLKNVIVLRIGGLKFFNQLHLLTPEQYPNLMYIDVNLGFDLPEAGISHLIETDLQSYFRRFKICKNILIWIDPLGYPKQIIINHN